ncbi:MAG: response regulator [Hungatella sp.]
MFRAVIIDDEPTIVEGITKVVPWERYHCCVVGTASNGQEGLAVIHREKPDLIFTDISMPGMDGLTMIAALRVEFPGMLISILTGYRDFDFAQRAIRLGVSRFLLKPSDMDEIEEALHFMTDMLAKRSEEDPVLLEADAEEAVEKPTDSEENAGSFIVKNALVYMGNHFKGHITLAEVAENTYVSQWHLSKLLNGHTGQSFSELLSHMRIEEAKVLLKDPSMRIGDISEEIGFLDVAHFSRVFKKLEGISANEYRNKRI